MGKAWVWVVAVVILLGLVGYLLVDGGYIAKWSGNVSQDPGTQIESPAGPPDSRPATVPTSSTASVVEHPSTDRPEDAKKASPVEEFFAGLSRGGWSSPFAIFGYCLVAVALIKAILGVKVKQQHSKG